MRLRGPCASSSMTESSLASSRTSHSQSPSLFPLSISLVLAFTFGQVTSILMAGKISFSLQQVSGCHGHGLPDSKPMQWGTDWARA
jgi:hypothetical protein